MVTCNECSGCDYNFCRREEEVFEKKVYVYTAENCPNCIKLKESYNKKGIVFVERSADRIKAPQDEIDREALVEASIQNMTLPVVVEI